MNGAHSHIVVHKNSHVTKLSHNCEDTVSTNTNDPFLIDSLRAFKGLSLRKLAEKSGLDPSSLSYWIRGKESRVSAERLKSAKTVLGLSVTGLLPGIHRWTIPSLMTSDVEKAEYIVREFCPGGNTFFPIRAANLLQAFIPGSLGNFLPWIAWVLVPVASPQIRIVLGIKPSAKHSNFLGSSRLLALKSVGGTLPDGSSPEEIPASAWISLPPEVFDRIKTDSDLSVSDLDAILGISGSPEWTWERLTAVLQGKGITAEETARKMGVL